MSHGGPHGGPPPPPAQAVIVNNGPSFIDVPDDYTARRRDPTTLRGVRRPDSLDPAVQHIPPTYSTGDELAVADMSAENLARLQLRLVRAGLIGPETKFRVGVPDRPTTSAFRELMGLSNREGLDWNRMLDELQTVPLVRSDGEGGLTTGSGETGGPSTSTETSVTRFTALDAESLAENAYAEALGQQKVAPAQVKALKKALNAYASANPSTTTVHNDGEGNSTSTTTGGIGQTGAAEIAEDFAQAQPNYAEVQATTTYFNALLRAVGEVGDVDAP